MSAKILSSMEVRDLGIPTAAEWLRTQEAARRAPAAAASEAARLALLARKCGQENKGEKLLRRAQELRTRAAHERAAARKGRRNRAA
jgi:hypothetical protein